MEVTKGMRFWNSDAQCIQTVDEVFKAFMDFTDGSETFDEFLNGCCDKNGSLEVLPNCLWRASDILDKGLVCAAIEDITSRDMWVADRAYKVIYDAEDSRLGIVYDENYAVLRIMIELYNLRHADMYML